MPDRSSGTTDVAYANRETWNRVNPLPDKYPDPPPWWNSCEKCERYLAEDDPIAIEMMMGALPNAVYCLECAS